MVYDESHHILALSECHGYPSALSKGEPSAPIKRFLRGGQGLLETVPALRGHMTSTPQQGEKVQRCSCKRRKAVGLDQFEGIVLLNELE